MKRLLYIILILSMLFGVAACQKTPESPIVQPKDLERMIEMAAQTPEPPADETQRNNEENAGSISPLYQRLGAPQTYQVDLEPRAEKLSITVDAVVQLPNADGLPIARVRPTQFTQEQVTTFFNLFCGDTPMYDAGPSGMTRAQLDENILMYQDRVRNDSSNKNAKAMLKFLEELRASEPDDIEETRSSGQLREMIFSTSKPDIGRYIGVSADEYPLDYYKRGKGFAVRNDMNVMDWDDESIDWGKEIGAGIWYSNPSNAPEVESYRPAYFAIADENIVPERAQSQLSITPAQARAQVDAMLKQSGVGFLTENVYLFEMLQDQEDGQPMTYGESSTGDILYNDAWAYETINIKINDSGVVEFTWRAPLRLMDTKVESCTLLPFSEIQSIFAKMLPITYAPQAESSNMTLEITDVHLEMARIVEQNSAQTGLIIPVWNFYGIRHRSFEGKETESTIKQILLCVNAIDGSIIDVQRGY